MIGVAQRSCGVGVEVFDLCFEVRGLPNIVVIKKGNEIASRQVETAVAGASRTAVPLHREDPHSGTLRAEPRDGGINRAIIHNDDFEIPEALAVHTRQRTLELFEPISRRHYYGDTRRHDLCPPRLAFTAIVLLAGCHGVAARNPARLANSHNIRRPSGLGRSKVGITTEIRNTTIYLS